MIGKILLTVLLAVAALLANGMFYGLVFGFRAKKWVVPSVLVSWALIIYAVWLR